MQLGILIYIHISITEEYYYLIIYYSPYFFFIIYPVTSFLYLVRSPYGEFEPFHEDFAIAQPGPLRTEPARRPFFDEYPLPKKEYQSARFTRTIDMAPYSNLFPP